MAAVGPAPPRSWGNKFNELFTPGAPSMQQLRHRYAFEELVPVQDRVNAVESQGDDGERFIRMPKTSGSIAKAPGGPGKRGRPPIESSPTARISRALTLTAHLYTTAEAPAFVQLVGTSRNAPGATCRENMAFLNTAIEGAICDLEAKFPERIKAIVTKLEVKETSKVDAHGVLVIEGEEGITTMAKRFERYLVARGAMSREDHPTDGTRVAVKSAAMQGPQELFEWIQYVLKASPSHGSKINRPRTRQMLVDNGIAVVGHSDDLLVHLHIRHAAE